MNANTPPSPASVASDAPSRALSGALLSALTSVAASRELPPAPLAPLVPALPPVPPAVPVLPELPPIRPTRRPRRAFVTRTPPREGR